MDRASSFPKQDFEGMACEIWQGLDACLYHAAYVRIYANTIAMHGVGSRRFHKMVRPQMSQTERDQLQEDLIVFRSHFAGVLWQLHHLGDELLRGAYKRCKQESILTDERHDELVRKLDEDPILSEIRGYRNLSHEFAGVIVTMHDSSTDAFIAHIFPSLGGKDADRNFQDRPVDEHEIKEQELNTKLEAYCNRLGGYCEGLFRFIDAKYKRTVFPRSRGFMVTIPHSYQGELPQGAKDVIYIRVDGSAAPSCLQAPSR
jgi:hypothetical protein